MRFDTTSLQVVPLCYYKRTRGTKGELHLIRRQVLLIFSVLFLGLIATVRSQTNEITVYKTSSCSCCSVWVNHLRENKFTVKVIEVESTAEYQRRNGVTNALRSCHTATVGGYTIEGHVPASEIQRLLREKPKAKGLAVPGMPVGSPGMEVGTRRDAFSVLLFDADGKTTVYRNYSAR